MSCALCCVFLPGTMQYCIHIKSTILEQASLSAYRREETPIATLNNPYRKEPPFASTFSTLRVYEPSCTCPHRT